MASSKNHGKRSASDPRKGTLKSKGTASKVSKPTKASTHRKKANNQQRPSPVIAPVSQIINKPPSKPLTVFAFGNGDSGELGMGSRVKETSKSTRNPFLDPNDQKFVFHLVQLACGGMHSVGLTANNKIVTWGVNDDGALGRPTDWDSGFRDIEDNASDTSEDLNPLESTPGQAVGSFPFDTRFVQVAAGDSCSFALTDTGLVYGWGSFKDTKGDNQFMIDEEGKLVKRQADPVLIPGLSKIKQVVCGNNHALALDANGDVWGWGSGDKNQLGRRHSIGRHRFKGLVPARMSISPNRVKYIASGEYHSFDVDIRGKVWAWGLNSFGQAGYAKSAGENSALLPYPMAIPALQGKRVVGLDGGAHHSLAVTAQGECLVWGRVDCGQLGLEFTPADLEDNSLLRFDERKKPRICLRPKEVTGLGKIAHACCGTDHTIFIDRQGVAHATGFGEQGQLGQGPFEDLKTPHVIRGQVVEDGLPLAWAGAGGQFTMVAGFSSI